MAKKQIDKHNLPMKSFGARITIIAAISVPLAWLTASSGVASIARTGNPALALRFAPWDAGANEAMADQLWQQAKDARDFGKAATYAQEALARSPLSPTAARVLGFVQESRGHGAAGRALVLQAATLSKRDLATRLWMIEDAVSHDDMRQALHQYDIALRPSPSARQILFPVLTEALRDKRLIGPLVQLFGIRPNWAGEFVQYALSTGKITETLSLIIARSPQISAPDADLRQQILDQLIHENKFSAAKRFYVTLSKQSSGKLINDPQFQDDKGFAPFTWTLFTTGSFGAERGSGMRFFADSSSGGIAATQLLTLPAGRYRLTITGFAKSMDRFGGADWSVTCASAPNTLLTSRDLPPKLQVVSTEFNVAQDCDAQWLKLTIRASQAPEGVDGVVREVRIDNVAS